MDKTTITKLLIQDILKYEKELGKYMGKEIANALTEEAHNAIRDFYTGYHPEYYERNYNFWNSYRKIHQYSNGKRIAGVELLVDQLPDDYRKQSGNTLYSSYASANPEDVFWRVYGFGWHGIASLQGRAPILSPSPYQRIINKRDEILRNQAKYQEMAKRQAQKEKYNLLF